MGKSNIIKSLEQLDKKDISSLILFTIFKLKESPQYSTLSELIYILDEDNFSRFLNYFGGKTITIPTVEEFNTILSALLVLERKENTEMTEDEIFSDIGLTKKEKDQVKQVLPIISEVIIDYDFKR